MPEADHYDQVPYPCLVHAQAHPHHIGALGVLFGVPAAALNRARVLELGCASGTQIVAFAAAYPEAICVGVDASARQITAGQARAAQLGLAQISLVCKAFSEWDAAAGDATFDYIVGHGIFSWVPPAVQAELLALIQRRLASGGLAYLSFNAMPGWAFGGLVRELLWRTSPGHLPSIERARAGRRWLEAAAQAAEPGTLLGATLIAEAAHIADHDDAYLEHEYFEAEHHPFWLEDVAARAAEHGLAYVTDADLGLVLPSTQVPSVQRAIAGLGPDLGPVACQQAIDRLTGTRFRRAIFTRAADLEGQGAASEASDPAAPRITLAPEGLARLHIALSHEREFVDGRDGRLATVRNARDWAVPIHDPALVAALAKARAAWPCTVPFADLVGGDLASPAARQLAGALVGLVFAGALTLTLAPIHAAREVAERPRVSAFVLAQAAEGEPLASPWMISQTISEPVRQLVLRVDGTRTPEEIAAELGQPIGEVVHRLSVLATLGFLAD